MTSDARCCPTDGTALVSVDRSGIVIDACPTCRGVWLDRGELDKLIEREASVAEDSDFLDEVSGRRDEPDRHRSDRDTDRHGKTKQKPGQRRRGLLESFLDFGD